MSVREDGVNALNSRNNYSCHTGDRRREEHTWRYIGLFYINKQMNKNIYKKKKYKTEKERVKSEKKIPSSKRERGKNRVEVK